MDAELKAHLQGMEDRTAALIAGEVGSLHTDIGERFARVETKLESIDSRLKLQAGLIQAGARAMARFSEFSESSEARWVDVTTKLDALRDRVEKLERGKDAA
jgi:hypothetical protein